MSDQSRHTRDISFETEAAREVGTGAAREVESRAAREGCGGMRSSRRAIALSWAVVVLWAVFIFCMSANTGNNLEHGGSIVSQVFQWLKGMQAQMLGQGVDVVNPAAHFCEYAVFGALLANAWRCLDGRAGAVVPWRAVALSVACASLYGVSDEFHQYFVPGRACDPIDWLVDTSGATLGAVLFKVVLSRVKARA